MWFSFCNRFVTFTFFPGHVSPFKNTALYCVLMKTQNSTQLISLGTTLGLVKFLCRLVLFLFFLFFFELTVRQLPPKEKKETKTKRITTVETPDGQTVEVDDEDLAQAALFKQMKTQFGNDALMKAMMQLVKQSQDQDK